MHCIQESIVEMVFFLITVTINCYSGILGMLDAPNQSKADLF